MKMVQVSLTLLLCLVGAVLSAPSETEADGASKLINSVQRSTKAIPSNDFTAIEEILAGTDSNAREKRSYCPCSTTETFGGVEGTPFVDVSTNPCSVQITEVLVCYGSLVDAIQLKYTLPNGNSFTPPLRGGTGGGLAHISIPDGGKLIGLFGGVRNLQGYGLVITQLRILVSDAAGNVALHGPFGTDFYDGVSTFSVFGDIKSIFGNYRQYLDGLGVFFEPLGVCATS